MIDENILLQWLAEKGFHKAKLLDKWNLQNTLDNLPLNHSSKIIKRIKSNLTDNILVHFLDNTKEMTFIVCALSCFRNESKETLHPNGLSAYGLIASFARRNYYREAILRLKKISIKIREAAGIKKQDIQIFCNSHIPEKFLAWASGLGFYGKNGLIISPPLGSQFIIAGLILPFKLCKRKEKNHLLKPGENCFSCRQCITSCPTGAIKDGPVIDLSKCIQSLSTQMIPLPENIKHAFMYNLYGCEICQDVCPFNKNLFLESQTTMGVLGPCVSLLKILTGDKNELKEYLKGTVLGASWIPPESIQRNSLIVAGNRKNPAITQIISPFLLDENDILQDTARWALNKINLK